MNMLRAIAGSGILSATLATLCAFDMLYRSISGSGTDRDLLLIIGMLLIALYGQGNERNMRE